MLTVAVPQLVAAWFVWRRDPRAGVVGLVVGADLVLWITVQLLVLQRYFFLQPVIAALGVLEMGLALGWVHRSRVAVAPTGHRTPRRGNQAEHS